MPVEDVFTISGWYRFNRKELKEEQTKVGEEVEVIGLGKKTKANHHRPLKCLENAQLMKVKLVTMLVFS